MAKTKQPSNKPVADKQFQEQRESITTATAIAERERLFLKVVGQLAEYEQKLRDLVEAVDVFVSGSYLSPMHTAHGKARELLDRKPAS